MAQSYVLVYSIIKMSRVYNRVPRVSLGSYHLTDLEYANDTLLLSTS